MIPRILLLLAATVVLVGCPTAVPDDDSGSDDDDSVEASCATVLGDIGAVADVPVPADRYGGWLAALHREDVSPAGLPREAATVEGAFVVTAAGYPVSYSICLPVGEYILLAMSDSDEDGQLCTAGDWFNFAQVEIAENEDDIAADIELNAAVGELPCRAPD